MGHFLSVTDFISLILLVVTLTYVAVALFAIYTKYKNKQNEDISVGLVRSSDPLKNKRGAYKNIKLSKKSLKKENIKEKKEFEIFGVDNDTESIIEELKKGIYKKTIKVSNDLFLIQIKITDKKNNLIMKMFHGVQIDDEQDELLIYTYGIKINQLDEIYKKLLEDNVSLGSSRWGADFSKKGVFLVARSHVPCFFGKINMQMLLKALSMNEQMNLELKTYCEDSGINYQNYTLEDYAKSEKNN